MVTKRITTTITKEYDEKGNLVKEVTYTIEEKFKEYATDGWFNGNINAPCSPTVTYRDGGSLGNDMVIASGTIDVSKINCNKTDTNDIARDIAKQISESEPKRKMHKKYKIK